MFSLLHTSPAPVGNFPLPATHPNEQIAAWAGHGLGAYLVIVYKHSTISWVLKYFTPISSSVSPPSSEEMSSGFGFTGSSWPGSQHCERFLMLNSHFFPCAYLVPLQVLINFLSLLITNLAKVLHCEISFGLVWFFSTAVYWRGLLQVLIASSGLLPHDHCWTAGCLELSLLMPLA